MLSRNVLVVLIALLSYTVVTAADSTSTSSPGAAWGVKLYGGPSLAASDDLGENQSFDGGTSWGGGIVALWGSRDFLDFGLQTELLYVVEGFDVVVTPQGNVSSITTPYEFGRLRLPVVGKLSFGAPLVLQPSIYLGGYAQYTTSATRANADIDSESLERFGYGLSMGADLRFLQIFLLDVRYNYGLSNDFKEDPYDTRVHSFTLGLTFIF